MLMKNSLLENMIAPALWKDLAAAQTVVTADQVTVEDSGKPLSDQKIVEVRRRQHAIEIARRTVAKYRSQLRIPSSSRRKRY